MYVYRLTMIGLQSNVEQDVRMTNIKMFCHRMEEGESVKKWWGANRNLMKLNTKLGSHKKLYRSKWMTMHDFYACLIPDFFVKMKMICW